MEQSVSIVYTHTLKYKLRPFLTGSSGDTQPHRTALSLLQSEVKRSLFHRLWVWVCARVSPTLAQNADRCRPGWTG